MRFYSFINFYLSQIQQGIQTAHLVSELLHDRAHELTREWADNHKTIICLNGGNTESLIELRNLFEHEANPYPWTDFYEDEQSLSGAFTAIGIVLPEQIYDAFYDEDSDDWIWTSPSGRETRYNSCSFNYDLLMNIKSRRLA